MESTDHSPQSRQRGNVINMRIASRAVPALAVVLAVAGCGATGGHEEDSPDDIVAAEAGCAEVVTNEYVEEQRPPEVDVRSVEQDGAVVTLTGISRGKSISPVPYEFTCRYSGGATVLASFERARHEETASPTTSETIDSAFDEFANSLSDDQFDKLIEGMKAETAELKCQAAAGREYVPADQKPYRAEFEPPIPYRGGYLVAGRIEGENGMVAVVGCEVDVDDNARVVRFDVVN